MTTFKLVPKPWGYYAESGARNEPTIEADLDWLMSGDDQSNVGPWSLRSEVLIEAIDDLPLGKSA